MFVKVSAYIKKIQPSMGSRCLHHIIYVGLDYRLLIIMLQR